MPEQVAGGVGFSLRIERGGGGTGARKMSAGRGGGGRLIFLEGADIPTKLISEKNVCTTIDPQSFAIPKIREKLNGNAVNNQRRTKKINNFCFFSRRFRR